MSDENAKKAISDVSHALEMWFGSQLAEWPDNPTKYFGTPAREAVMAGRASRDAEVERLQAEVKSLRANWENECGNLEMAERRIRYLESELAEITENRNEWASRMMELATTEQKLAERDSVIERVRDWLDNVTPTPADWDVLDAILNDNPPIALDALIREKQAEALEEAADYVDWYVARPVGMNNTDQQYFRPWHSKWLRNLAADYRNEVDHE